MSNEEIIDVMSKSEGCRVKCVEKDGSEWTGIVDVYESDYDNECDDYQGHSTRTAASCSLSILSAASDIARS